MIHASRVGRDTWLVLSAGGPGSRLDRFVDGRQVYVVASAEAFADTLIASRAGLVIETPPGSTGEIELVVREQRRRPELQAVLLNPADGMVDRLRALEMGFDEALPSTIASAELAGRLEHLVRGIGAEDPRRIRVTERAELDLRARELRRDGEPVHLRPREFDLLALLATHPRRAYSRRDLILRLWGRTYQGDMRTVDVHVRWLRSKIEDDPERPAHLVTVHGVGYRLDPPPSAAPGLRHARVPSALIDR